MNKHFPRRGRPIIVALALVLLLTHPASGKFANLSEPVPADRLIRSLRQHIQQNPSDAEALYTLGRVHSLVYAKAAFPNEAADRLPADQIRIIPADKRTRAQGEPAEVIPGFEPTATVQVGQGRDRSLQHTPAARDHLLLSLDYYQQAVEADPEIPLYRLGYGWMLEQASHYFTESEPTTPTPTPTTAPATSAPATGSATITAAGQPTSQPTQYREQAIEQYRKVIDLRLEEELAADQFLNVGPDTILSREAAQGILRLLEADDVQPEERGEIQRMREAIAQLQAKPMAITPLIFSLEPAQSFDDLLDPTLTTRFDLMGDGRDREWPWVRLTTALLVWDPDQAGAITSGRQLFGSVTWWMFWDTGYDALSMLDDNRDGYVRGEELNGIAAWFDRNSNGVSDEGEVVPLAQLGVAALGTGATAGDRPDLVAWNEHGVEMTDGRTLPTWDWRPVSAPDVSVSDDGNALPGRIRSGRFLAEAVRSR